MSGSDWGTVITIRRAVIQVSMDSTPLQREREILDAALNRIRDLVPPGWRLESADLRGDVATVVRLQAPDGRCLRFAAKASRVLVTRDLPWLVDMLTATADSAVGRLADAPAAQPLVIARYLSTPVQSWLTERNIAFADATGNVRVTGADPAVFLRDVGAAKDPWRGSGRPKGNLTGEPAARIVRTLADYTPPYSVPELIRLAGTSSGATYRVVQFLVDQLLVERQERGPIENVRLRQMIQRWSGDYGFQRTNTTSSFLAPRGLSAVVDGLRDLASEGTLRYAVTGSLAAQQWAAHAPARTAMIYCTSPVDLADRLDFRHVDSGANVLVATPAYDVVFDRAEVREEVVFTAPSQTAVDLLTGPGRSPAEAEALLDWMESNVESWRR